MLIPITCKSCKAEYEVDAEEVHPGSTLTCPECEAEMLIPKLIIGPGVTIGGYSIIRKLGEGAMGQVFLAKQLSMDRDIALKILPPQFTVNEETVLRFQQEVRMAAKVEHPNLVTAYGAGEDNGVHYLAIRYVDGVALDEKLESEGMLSEHQALTIVRKISTALKKAWDKQELLHRDIKPANIMLGNDGEPQLTDLGLAKSMKESSSLTMTSMAMGTPNYMSPEQIDGVADMDCRADIYSLGATLYNLLTNQVPFSGSTMTETLMKQLTQTLPDPRNVNPDISEGCVALIELMLAKKREERYQNYSDLIDDLDMVLKHAAPKHELGGGESVLIRAGEVRQKSTSNRIQQVKEPAAAATKQAPTKKPASKIIPIVAVAVVAVGGGLWAMMNKSDSTATPSTASIAKEEPLTEESITEDRGPETTQASIDTEDKSFIDPLRAQLIADNPGLTDVDITLEENGHYAIIFDSPHVTNLSALANLKLSTLALPGANIQDLSGLEGSSINRLVLNQCKNLSDLSALEKVSDLYELSIIGASFKDLSPLKKLELRTINLRQSQVTDLSPLQGQPLTKVFVSDLASMDLSPLTSSPLETVGFMAGSTIDVTPLAKMRPQPKLIKATSEQMKVMRQFSDSGIRQRDLAKAAEPDFSDLILPVLDALLNQDLESAQKELETLSKNKQATSAPEWKDLQPLLAQAVDLENILLQSYNAQKGKQASVYLNTGMKKVRINGVDGDTVKAEVVLMSNGSVIGSSPANFSYNDLSIKEKLIRLGKEAKPDTDVLKGLLMLQANEAPRALQYFHRSGNALAQQLRLRIEGDKKVAVGEGNPTKAIIPHNKDERPKPPKRHDFQRKKPGPFPGKRFQND